MYTRPPMLDLLPRAYCHLIIAGRAIPALVDTGADTTVIPEIQARLAGIAYEPTASAIGVGGPVPTFAASSGVLVDLDVPVVHGRSIRWMHLGKHEIRPVVVRAPGRIPALIGRRDILIAYRFTLIEREQVFDLTPLT